MNYIIILLIVIFFILFFSENIENIDQKNIYGNVLETCSTDPMTGWKRDGKCNTDENDQGTHTVCAQVTDEFLEYTNSQGNDLTTPNDQFKFPGLKEGDKWCLCALRWKQAHEAGVAPLIDLNATNRKTLDYIDEEILKNYEMKDICVS
jgi:uncharacterized protein (DUF2237 family)